MDASPLMVLSQTWTDRKCTIDQIHKNSLKNYRIMYFSPVFLGPRVGTALSTGLSISFTQPQRHECWLNAKIQQFEQIFIFLQNFQSWQRSYPQKASLHHRFRKLPNTTLGTKRHNSIINRVDRKDSIAKNNTDSFDELRYLRVFNEIKKI